MGIFLTGAMEKMSKKEQEVILVCNPLDFFGPDDEAMFFEKLKTWKFVVKSWGIIDDFFIKVKSRVLEDDDFYELFALMARYGYDLEQMRVFVDKNNEPFIEESELLDRMVMIPSERKSLQEIEKELELRNKNNE